MTTRFEDERVYLDLSFAQNSPALVMKASSGTYLVIADVHLGAAISGGINYSGIEEEPKEMCAEIFDLASSYDADRLAILGDVKHSKGRPNRYEAKEISVFFEGLTKRLAVWLVKGNHDAGVDDYVGSRVYIAGKEGLSVDGALLTHGNSMPARLEDYEVVVMGHVHPHALVKGRVTPVWLVFEKRRAHPKKVIVVPHFNKALTRIGYTPTDPYGLSPILKEVKRRGYRLRAIDLTGRTVGDDLAWESV